MRFYKLWIFLLLNFSLAAALHARNQVISNFDDALGSPSSYKDENGTQFKISNPKYDAARNKVLSIQYKIVKGGWGVWIASLKGVSAQEYSHLTFLVCGDDGGEKFDLGLKDSSMVEKKLPVTQFVDVSKEWRKVKIPLKLFEGVNLASLDNFNIGFPDSSEKGRIFVDDVQFETADLSDQDRTASGTFANKVAIDGFERPNPTDLYLVYEGDNSTLILNASRVAKEGDYSMELEYTLSTSRAWGSWVSAHWQSKETMLDWRGTEDVKFWVKGDGSGNIIRFSVTDADREKWICDNTEISKSTRWELVTMPISKFTLKDESLRKNGKLDLEQVRAYDIMVVGLGGSDATSGIKTSVGKIQVDQLYLSGEQINAVWAVPPIVAKTEKTRLLKIGNIDFNGQIYTEFMNAPEQKSTVIHYGKLIANGKVDNYSARIEIASPGQEFGEAARYSIEESTKAQTTAVSQTVNESQVNLQGFANNLSPYLTQVTVGNVYVDYSNYTFSPVWGFKGLTAEGDVGPLNYHVFVLKHRYDSFTLGSRSKVFWNKVRLTAISVYFRETARINNPALVKDGVVQAVTNPDIQLQKTQDDWVYTLDMERPFFEEKVSLGGTYGYNRYNLDAFVDRTNPFDPVINRSLDASLQLEGEMFRGRIALNNVLLPGFRVNYEYRNVDNQFKPRYRQSPVGFDENESDQRGHNMRFVESWRGFTTSLEYDTIERFSDRKYFRHRMNWAIGYAGFEKLDISFSQEVRRETYAYTSSRTGVSVSGKNDKVTGSEIYIRVQLTPRTSLFLIPRREDIMHPETGLTFATEALYGKLECYATSNLKLLGEFRTTHYGQKDGEAKGYPYDDNFIRLKAEFNF